MKHRIGFSAGSFDEVLKASNVKGANLIELKLENFCGNPDETLFKYDGNRFNIVHKNAVEIKKMCREKDIEISVHAPYEISYNDGSIMGLCQAERKHHIQILRMYETIGNLFNSYGIGIRVTAHGPGILLLDGHVFDEDDALRAGNELYVKLSRRINENGYKFRLGIENTVHPEIKRLRYLGSRIEHFAPLLKGTGFGTTVDTGHKNLNPEMKAEELLNISEVINCHFHSNNGIVSGGFEDDMHTFASNDNLPEFYEYLKYFKKHSTPIVLELIGWTKHNNFLNEYIKLLRKELDDIVI